MITLQLVRKSSSDQGTFGNVTLPDGTVIQTGECPNRNNESGLSDVIADSYLVTMQPSAHFGCDLYHLEDKHGRTNCMIHNGNWCGDTTKGLKSDVEGCILLGMTQGQLEGQEAVLQSDEALKLFNSTLNGAPFMLVITEQYEG